MTPEEWRQGLRRLALVSIAVLVAVALLAWPFAERTGSWQQGFANATAIVAIPFLLGGVAVHLRGDARTRKLSRRGNADTPDELEQLRQIRKGNDRFALGLLAAGALLFVVAVTLG